MANLERRLGLGSVVVIGVSSMIGSGVFLLPGIGFDITGPSLYLAFLLAAICLLPTALSKAELATAMPTSGGIYIYIERTFGPFAGTIAGLGLFISILLKSAFTLIGSGLYLSAVANIELIPVALILLLVIVALNILGVGKISSLFTITLVVTLIGLSILVIFSVPHWQTENLSPALTSGLEGFSVAMALVFVSFAGITKIVTIAEEIKTPEKNIYKGIIISLLIVTSLYIIMSLVLALSYQQQNIANELKPIFRLAQDSLGSNFAMVMALIAFFTLVNTTNAGVLAASRFPFAMARDNILPSFLGKLNSKFLTPVSSIILSGVIMSILIIFLDIAKIAKLASAFLIFLFVLTNLTVIVLRESQIQWYKPNFKSPLYPFLQIFGILSGLILMGTMGPIALIAILSITIPGVLIFIFYSRKNELKKGVIGIKGKRKDLLANSSPELYQDGFCSFDLKGDAQVVITLFGRERSPETLVQMGLALAEHKHIEVSYILEIPEQTDIHDVLEEPVELKSVRRRVSNLAKEMDDSIAFDPIVSHDLSKTVYEISQSLHCKWLLIEWGGKNREGFTINNPIAWLKPYLHCHVATFKDAGIRYIKKIAVLIKGEHNDSLAIQTAKHLAKEFNASIQIYFYNSNCKQSKSSDIEAHLTEFIEANDCVQTIIDNEDKLQAVLSVTNEYDLLIHGSSSHSRIRQLFGTFDDKLMSKAACSVLKVHRAKAE